MHPFSRLVASTFVVMILLMMTFVTLAPTVPGIGLLTIPAT
jgi:hypothetical protein